MEAGLSKLFKIWGWNTQGDFGPFTMYTNKQHKLVAFLKAPPKEPPSGPQIALMQRFATAAHAWNQLDAPTRARWRLAVRRANLRIGANALHTYYLMQHDPDTIRTIEHQTNLQLLPD